MFFTRKNLLPLLSIMFSCCSQPGKLVATFGEAGRVDLHDGLDRSVKDLYVASTTSKYELAYIVPEVNKFG